MTNEPANPLQQEDKLPRAVVSQIAHHDVETLARTKLVQVVEVASLVFFLGGETYLFYRLWPHLSLLSGFMVGATALSAYVAADFISGLFHWMGDTWGSPETPLAGKVFVRPFREHHIDQKAITRHGFIEVNGANCAISLGPLLGTHFLAIDEGRMGAVLLALFLGTFLFWIFLTNQFHSWAHQDQPPKIVAWLQKMHLILPDDHHQVHHAAPYMKYYCITNGWLNEPLHRLRFFRVLEKIISATTGMIPRKDDIGEKAAVAIAAETDVPLAAPLSKEPSVSRARN
jgi:plasmanylethanolamine desaturase